MHFTLQSQITSEQPALDTRIDVTKKIFFFQSFDSRILVVVCAANQKGNVLRVSEHFFVWHKVTELR